MEIIVKKDEFSTSIEDLNIGEGFIYNNDYFIRISDDGGIVIDSDDYCLAVSLEDYSSLHSFIPSTKVKPVKNVKIIIEE